MKLRDLALSMTLIAFMAPLAPGGGTESATGTSIQLAGIAGTGAPQHRLDCEEADDLATAGCTSETDEGSDVGATDRGG